MCVLYKYPLKIYCKKIVYKIFFCDAMIPVK